MAGGNVIDEQHHLTKAQDDSEGVDSPSVSMLFAKLNTVLLEL